MKPTDYASYKTQSTAVIHFSLVSVSKQGQVILSAPLFCSWTLCNNSVMLRKKTQVSIAAWSSGRKCSFLLLPLGFFAQSWPEASVGFSVAAPVSGSPAGRNPSHVLGLQLAPKCQNTDAREINK